MDHNIELKLQHLDPEDRLLAHRLLSHVPENGETVGNATLRTLLKLRSNEHRYWDVRNRLIDLDLLERCGGRGGSVRLAAAAKATVEPLAPPRRERELYEPMSCVLQ